MPAERACPGQDIRAFEYGNENGAVFSQGKQHRPAKGLAFVVQPIHRIAMPIRAENRWLYPIDWTQLSNAVRFDRAGSCCERCARPHLRYVPHLGDGRWWDAPSRCWRSDRGKRVSGRGVVGLTGIRTTYVVLACAHLDHDPGNNSPANLAALCQRCHMIHDAAEHRWQRWWNVYRLCAVRDLFEDPRITRARLAKRALSVGGRRGVTLAA